MKAPLVSQEKNPMKTKISQLPEKESARADLDNNKIRDVIKKLSSTNSELKESKTSRTSRLWINYINYINIMKTFIRAERIGNCHLYLTAVANMINLFSATWHIHYAKVLVYTYKPCKTYHNNIHGYISSLLKRVVISYTVPIPIGLVYGLILSYGRSLCELLKVKEMSQEEG